MDILGGLILCSCAPARAGTAGFNLGKATRKSCKFRSNTSSVCHRHSPGTRSRAKSFCITEHIIQTMDPGGEVIYSGVLRKKGGRVNVWSERFFVLKGGTLYYYVKSTDAVSSFSLQLPYVSNFFGTL
jgi:hypothetical protein